jgi:hypothetical protein
VSIRFIAVIVAAARVACSGSPDGPTEEEPSPSDQDVAVETEPDAARSPTEAPPTADELAAMAPIDLMVDLGSEGWDARYHDGAVNRGHRGQLGRGVRGLAEDRPLRDRGG